MQQSLSLLCQRPARLGLLFLPLLLAEQLCLHSPGNHSPRLMELLPRAKPNMTFSLCVWQPGRVKQPPPALLLTFIMARCKSSCAGPAPSDQHVFQSFTLLPDSVFQYFALNLLLYLISLQQLFSTLTTNHKSISLCVRDCLCLRMLLVSEGACGCTAVCEPAPEHSKGTDPAIIQPELCQRLHKVAFV